MDTKTNPTNPLLRSRPLFILVYTAASLCMFWLIDTVIGAEPQSTEIWVMATISVLFTAAVFAFVFIKPNKPS